MDIHIPPDIITDILHRLPSKSLARFRCVSKTWLTQTTNPLFIITHHQTLNHHHLIFDSNHTTLYSLPITPHNNQTLTNINLNLNLNPSQTFDMFLFNGSCNGLVLAFVENFTNAHSLIVFNPITRQHVELPNSGYDVINNLLEIDIMYGFGYDSVNDDYKVVTVSYFHYNYLIPTDNMYVHVYSLRDGNWRRVGDSPYDHSHGRSLHGVYVNGFVHWVVRKGFDGLCVIVAFSLVDETFSEMPMPDLGDRGVVVCTNGYKLVVVGEKLGLFVEHELWLMNEYGVRESWSKILLYGFDEVSVVDPEILYEDGKIMLVSDGIVWVYDVEGKCFGKSIDISRKVKGLKVIGSYVESLVSPKLV